MDTSRRLSVFERDRMTVWYYPGARIVHHCMSGPVLGEVFRNALSAGAEMMQKNYGHKWLSDDRLNGALLPDDLQWVDKVWHAQAVAAGWTHWALLPPASVVGQMNIRKHIALYKERGIMVEVFTDLDKAFAWLEAQT